MSPGDPSSTAARKVSAGTVMSRARASVTWLISRPAIRFTTLVAFTTGRCPGRNVRERSASTSSSSPSADASAAPASDRSTAGSRSENTRSWQPSSRESSVEPACDTWKMKSQLRGSGASHGRISPRGTTPVRLSGLRMRRSRKLAPR